MLPRAGAVTFVNVDSLLRRVYGKRKQGAAFGHAKVGGYQVLLRGLNPLVSRQEGPQDNRGDPGRRVGAVIARRVPDVNKTAIDAQNELFTVWRYHAAFTDSPFILLQAEAQHRGHAVIEQVFAELIDGPWPTCPAATSTPTTPG